MINHQVPFYSNTLDNTHCFQAALKMVLKYFYPNEDYSWEQLDLVSAKVKGLWTWPTAGLIWLKEKGLNVTVTTAFDYETFITDGGAFLIAKYGEEVGREQIGHSNIEQEKVLAQRLLNSIAIKKSVPTIDEITNLLSQGYLVICNVNSQVLNEQNGYVGHFVLVKGFENTQLILHDPGLPPFENRKIHFDVFEKAWAYPTVEAKDIFAFKNE